MNEKEKNQHRNERNDCHPCLYHPTKSYLALDSYENKENLNRERFYDGFKFPKAEIISKNVIESILSKMSEKNWNIKKEGIDTFIEISNYPTIFFEDNNFTRVFSSIEDFLSKETLTTAIILYSQLIKQFALSIRENFEENCPKFISILMSKIKPSSQLYKSLIETMQALLLLGGDRSVSILSEYMTDKDPSKKAMALDVLSRTLSLEYFQCFSSSSLKVLSNKLVVLLDEPVHKIRNLAFAVAALLVAKWKINVDPKNKAKQAQLQAAIDTIGELQSDIDVFREFCDSHGVYSIQNTVKNDFEQDNSPSPNIEIKEKPSVEPVEVFNYITKQPKVEPIEFSVTSKWKFKDLKSNLSEISQYQKEYYKNSIFLHEYSDNDVRSIKSILNQFIKEKTVNKLFVADAPGLCSALKSLQKNLSSFKHSNLPVILEYTQMISCIDINSLKNKDTFDITEFYHLICATTAKILEMLMRNSESMGNSISKNALGVVLSVDRAQCGFELQNLAQMLARTIDPLYMYEMSLICLEIVSDSKLKAGIVKMLRWNQDANNSAQSKGFIVPSGNALKLFASYYEQTKSEDAKNCLFNFAKYSPSKWINISNIPDIFPIEIRVRLHEIALSQIITDSKKK